MINHNGIEREFPTAGLRAAAAPWHWQIDLKLGKEIGLDKKKNLSYWPRQINCR
jgi:hypothetical protein